MLIGTPEKHHSVSERVIDKQHHNIVNEACVSFAGALSLCLR